MEQGNTATAILLAHNELSYLMHLSGVKALLGLDPASFTGSAQAGGRQSLLSRSLIQAGKEAEQDKILGGLLRYLQPVFFAHRALMVVRAQPQAGILSMVVYARGKNVTLHSMPETDRHLFTALSSAEDMVRPLLDWFPIAQMRASSSEVFIPRQALDQFHQHAEQGPGAAILQAVQNSSMEAADKQALVRAFQNVAISGSFASVSFSGKEQAALESMAVLTDQQTAWTITVPGAGASDYYRVRRTGADFPRTIKRMCAWVGS